MRGISVIIPTYNSASFLEETLQSVLHQTLQPSEIIVIDDGSTDATEFLIKKFSTIKYIYQDNAGTAVALNTGVAAAQGDFFAFLDADDIWLSSKLEKQMHIMDEFPSTDLIFTQIENFIDESIFPEARDKISPKIGRIMNGIHKSALLIRSSSFYKIGLFTAHDSIDFLDWYARSKEHQLIERMVSEVLVRRRIHGKNQTMTNSNTRSDFPKIIKAILDRRRSKNG